MSVAQDRLQELDQAANSLAPEHGRVFEALVQGGGWTALGPTPCMELATRSPGSHSMENLPIP